jgi:hypothetical protein
MQVAVRALEGGPVADDPGSPVLLIGNSFGYGFREQLVRQANLLVRTRTGNDRTTEALADFLRDPELLNRVKVVVWVTTEHHFKRFKPLPRQVAAAGAVGNTVGPPVLAP